MSTALTTLHSQLSPYSFANRLNSGELDAKCFRDRLQAKKDFLIWRWVQGVVPHQHYSLHLVGANSFHQFDLNYYI